MATGLAELKQACKSTQVRTEEDLLATGESVWFMGRPVEARNGMVEIAQTEEMHLVIREKDILDVKRKDEFYLVQVRGSANVIARFQQVLRADCVMSSPRT